MHEYRRASALRAAAATEGRSQRRSARLRSIPGELHLRLLGGFELRAGDQVVVPPLPAQRLLAFVALQHASLARGYVAGVLWPDLAQRQANGYLRTAVWQSRRTVPDAVEVTATHLRLSDEVGVDFDVAAAVAQTVLNQPADSDTLPAPELIESLQLELLPDWFDEWLVFERERWNQLRLHALESVAEHLLRKGLFAQAVDAALVASSVEPLRESASRLLIRIHLAEGNLTQALAAYTQYRQRLDRELRVPPSAEMQRLITEAAQRRTDAGRPDGGT